MMIYVNHTKESAQLCAKLIIKRKPVQFTPEEWCTRLKTTPYRERPQKCFFVHDEEKRSLFEKCENASNRLTNDYLIRSILCIFILLFHYIRT